MPHSLRRQRNVRRVKSIAAPRQPIQRERYELTKLDTRKEFGPGYEAELEREMEARAMPKEQMPGDSTILERLVYKALWELGYRPPDLDFQSSSLGARLEWGFGRQVADFAIWSLGIIIEVQGEYWHHYGDQAQRDMEREVRLRLVPRPVPWLVYFLEERIIRDRVALHQWMQEHIVHAGVRREDQGLPHIPAPWYGREELKPMFPLPDTGDDWSGRSPVNYLINGGFEADATYAIGWTAQAGATATIVDGTLRINATAADNGVYQEVSGLRPSAVYTVVCRVNTGGNEARIFTTSGEEHNLDETVKTASMTQFSGLCRASATGTLTVYLTAHTTGVNIDFDDVCLFRGYLAFPFVPNALDAWRHPSDSVLIDGGDIYAASITADKFAVIGTAGGARIQITPTGIEGYDATPTQTFDFATDGSFWFGAASGANSIVFDGATLSVNGALTIASGSGGGWTIDATSLHNTANTVTMRGAGNLAFGATPPTAANAGTGLFLDSTGLYGLNANAQQFYLRASDGRGMFGGGHGVLDRDGLSLDGNQAVVTDYNSVRWMETMSPAPSDDMIARVSAGKLTLFSVPAYTLALQANPERDWTAGDAVLLAYNQHNTDYAKAEVVAFEYATEASLRAIFKSSMSGTPLTEGSVSVNASDDNPSVSLTAKYDTNKQALLMLDSYTGTNAVSMSALTGSYTALLDLYTQTSYAHMRAMVNSAEGWRITTTNTATSPRIVLFGDTDTGFWQSAADNLDFSVGGASRLRVTANAIPAPGAGLSVGWNRSGGNAEVNFYNLHSNPGYGYVFSIKTGEATYTDLFLLRGNGEVLPGGNETQSLGTDVKEWKEVWALDTSINHSDLRDKTDLDESLGMEFVRLLKPRSWRWNTEETKGKRRHSGLVAQDVLAALTTLGVPTSDFAGYVYSPNTQKHYLRLGEFIGPIVKAVQDLDQRLTILERGQGGIDGRP